MEACSKKKAQLADLLGCRVQGALVRSRFQTIDQMDVPSKYFFSMEKKNGQKRDGALLSDYTDIHRRSVIFYENLYRSELDPGRCVESVFFDNLPKVSEEANVNLSGGLTVGELFKALQSMESGRAPGVDSLPVDFYKAFWLELGEDLLEVLRASLTEGRLPLSCQGADMELFSSFWFLKRICRYDHSTLLWRWECTENEWWLICSI